MRRGVMHPIVRCLFIAAGLALVGCQKWTPVENPRPVLQEQVDVIVPGDDHFPAHERGPRDRVIDLPPNASSVRSGMRKRHPKSVREFSESDADLRHLVVDHLAKVPQAGL